MLPILTANAVPPPDTIPPSSPLDPYEWARNFIKKINEYLGLEPLNKNIIGIGIDEGRVIFYQGVQELENFDDVLQIVRVKLQREGDPLMAETIRDLWEEYFELRRFIEDPNSPEFSNPSSPRYSKIDRGILNRGTTSNRTRLTRFNTKIKNVPETYKKQEVNWGKTTPPPRESIITESQAVSERTSLWSRMTGIFRSSEIKQPIINGLPRTLGVLNTSLNIATIVTLPAAIEVAPAEYLTDPITNTKFKELQDQEKVLIRIQYCLIYLGSIYSTDEGEREAVQQDLKYLPPNIGGDPYCRYGLDTLKIIAQEQGQKFVELAAEWNKLFEGRIPRVEKDKIKKFMEFMKGLTKPAPGYIQPHF